MTAQSERVNEDDLQAYVDDVLEPARRAAVEAYLAERPEGAERIAAYRTQNRLLQAAFVAPAGQDIPDRLLDAAAGRPRRTAHWWRQIAAAVAMVAVGGAGGWLAHDAAVPPPVVLDMAARATSAHQVYVVEVKHPVEVGAEEEEHLVGWLSNRIGQTIEAPDLSRFGFQLVGGRLLPAGGRPAAQFMYERADGQRITCYMTGSEDGRETAFRVQESDGVTALYWLEGGLGYVMVGDAERDEMVQMARAVYDEMNRDVYRR